jgi:type IV secretory pathway TraG/TraD family ATPase VirD4
VLHYPGPVISTTTKADVFALTSGVRAGLGPVHVFNPQSIGNVPSTFCWSPLQGCQAQAVAIRRADAFAQAVSQKASRTAPSGPPRPATTCGPTSTPPPWPART